MRIRFVSWLLLLGAVCGLTAMHQTPAVGGGGTWPHQRTQICYVYVDRPVYIEKIVYVEKVVEKPVEKIVYIDRWHEGDVRQTKGKLHMLLLLATADRDVGWAVKETRSKFDQLFLYNLAAARRGNIQKIDEDKLKATDVLDALKALKVEEDDTLLVYFNGHGEESGEDQSLLMAEGVEPKDAKLSRAELRKLLFEKKCKLKLLITDACFGPEEDFGSTNPGTVFVRPPKEGAPPPKPRELRRIVPNGYENDVVNDLFFNHTGELDLSSSDRGEYAVTQGFSDSFFEMVQDYESYAGKVEWKAFIPVVQRRVTERFEFYKPEVLKSLRLPAKVRDRITMQKGQTVFKVKDESGKEYVPEYQRERRPSGSDGARDGGKDSK